MKKILAALLLAILVLSAVPCLAESVPTIRITIVMNPLVTDYEDNYFTKWIEEAYGCKLEFTFLPTGEDAKTKLNVMIAGGEDLGDVLMIEGLDKATIQNYADAGAFYDLTPYFESQDTNLEKLSEEIGEDLVAAIKTATGEIWAYPDYYPETNNMTKYRAWINQTWLDNLGLEMPTTPEELYTVLKAFKEQDANGNGDPDDEIPMLGAPSWSADPCVYLTNAFVYWDDVEDLIITDGKIDAAYVQEGYKEALTYMNRLVSEGLLAPETFTITEGQYREYLSTETPTVGVCFYTHLGFVGPTDENKNQYQYMPYLIGADGKQRVSYQPYDISVMSHCYIPTSAKDPDLSFDFINWLFSEETYVRARFGVEGVHYDKVNDPETLELLKSNHPFAIMEYDNGWGESNNMSWQNTFGYFTGSSWMCQWNGDPNYYFYKRVVAVDDMMSKVPGVGEYVPSLTYTAEETEQYNELKNNISTFWKEYRTRFILGELNIETEWQSYLDTLYNDLHLEDYLAIVQGAYDRQFGA